MGITATDLCGLEGGITYYFKVNDVEYSITTPSAGYVVAGAGLSIVNGTYLQNGTFNGKPKYDLPGGYYLFYSFITETGYDQWIIWDTVTNPVSTSSIYYYGNDNTGKNPDEISWSIGTGTPPAPTVTESEDFTSYVELAQLIDTEIDPAGFEAVIVGAAPNQDIRIRNVGVKGWSSYCEVSNGTTSPDLFTNLRFWSRFRIPPENNRIGIILSYSASGGMDTTGYGTTTYDVIYVYTSSGGATLSGEAIVEYRVFIASGGITMGGSAITVRDRFWTMTGGAELSGSADTEGPGELETGRFYGDMYYSDGYYETQ